MVNEVSTAAGAQALMTAAVLVLVALAAREDLTRNRIPNALAAAGAGLGATLSYVAAGGVGLMDAAGGALVGLAVFLPFYLLRGMGAGDVKLMAAAGTFVGTVGAFWAAMLALIAGGALALAIVGWRVIAPQSTWEQSVSADVGGSAPLSSKVSAARKQRFPYAVPIGAGVLGALWMQGSLSRFYAMLGLL